MGIDTKIETRYNNAKERYAEIGVDTDIAIERVNKIPISIQCWQADDVEGFEKNKRELSGGIQATGNYLGKARNCNELKKDIEQVFRYVPGEKKLNLHAIYLDSQEYVERDEISPEHFVSWVEWAKQQKVGLDFNPSCFSHQNSESGLTLSHPRKEIRDFWIRHIKQSRKISSFFGKELRQQSIMNIWIPDGFKDTPVDLLGPRKRLKESLDECLEEKIPDQYHLDAVESKLFGIGSESYVVGSHEFYLGYAIEKKIALCLDAGHFHPTEVISNKLSSVSLYLDNILLHVSRPVRWDSDHVVTLSEELIAISQELIRHNLEKKVHVGMDFFDASINRVAALIIGARNVRKSLLISLLEPKELLFDAENNFDFTKRLVYQEELKGFPWQDVWNYYCIQTGVKTSFEWFDDIKRYENDFLSKR